ncbi:MAG: DUF192 domain-containing protein [Sphingopyxis sp.]|uniref:DUF192 domain-containing protein n=1 Tax=Sphingopyxis sp. TaxID=1908224 RepID=UPI002AB913BA|nr:DUF192 domain-containing protein [Sphingopyxis sp.]MDZ3830709.1 DUF192 domain-containing protein [Sphingopyxis sp.]
MRAMFLAFSFVLAAPLAACSDRAGSADEQAGMLPVTIQMAGQVHRFEVEVARSAEEQARGLMFRTALPVDGGMLFPFEKPRIASFWMKNTLIPLDMIFIRADGSIDRIAENTIPESLEPVASGGEVAAVLELAGGTVTRLNVDESATVTWKDGQSGR